MISNIVHTLGGGSGVDTLDLVDKLVELQSAPEDFRLDSREELLNSQISDFGLLRSAMSELESAVQTLGNEDTFNAKSVSVPDTSLISLTTLNSTAPTGTYKLAIEQVAQAQSLSSGSYASLDDAVGTGTLTIRLGNWNAALDTFTVDPDKTGAAIVIDDTNNSLQGLRDAINEADIGVQASIISDGGGYKLQLSGPSGASNEVELVAVEDVGNPGLANFNFSEASQNLTEEQEGLDAQIRINGLLVSRDSNTIDDVIQGLEFDIFNSSATEVINLSITEDKDFAETAIRDFVDTYNLFLENIESLIGFNSELEDFGSLRNDPLAGNLVGSIKNFLGASVTGIDDGFTVLANIGIRTKLDGTLEINEDANQVGTNFRAAIDNNFDLVKDFFIPRYESSDTNVEVNNYGPRTKSGSYEVVISQEAAQGALTGTAVLAGFPIDTTGKDYSFDVVVDGTTASISLPDATIYADGDALAAEIQSLINLEQGMQDADASVSVSYTGGALSFASDDYGSDSSVAITAVGADAAELGLAIDSGTDGVDVVGTVDGVTAFGFGKVLLPALSSDAEGLKMIIKPGATTATVNFSRGFGGGLSELINNFLANNGLISQREDTLENKQGDVADDRVLLERRTEAYRARLESQFLAMELIVRSLNNTSTFLSGIADRLPFTAQK